MRAEEWRCLGRAELLVELQGCGGAWPTTVASYMKANKAAPRSGSSPAADLGLGPAGRKHLAAVAKAYSVEEKLVGDKAAKASELCLGGMEKVSANPSVAVRKVAGALESAARIAANERSRRDMPLDEVFVTYVTADCPEPSEG